MPLIDYFRTSKKQTSASVAKDRLQIIVAHQRGERSGPDYLPQMKQEIIEVIKKYVTITEEQVSVQMEQNDENLSVLELNVTIPENSK